MKRKWSSILTRLFLATLLLVTALACPSSAQTLYERSLAQFNARAGQAATDDYTFVVLGDSRDGDETFAKALAMAKSFDPLFILHGGDYSSEGGEAETASFLALVQRTVPEIPLFVVFGNHEDRRVFPKEIGPYDFTLTAKRLDLTLVALDNADGSLRPPQLDWLRAELASARGTVFVAMHIPPRTDRWRGHTFKQGADELRRIVAKSRVQGLFFSHSHQYDRSEFGGVPAFITGGAGAPLVWFAFNGERVHHILVVRVKKGRANFQMVPIK
ncbi:MAG TPA: phosphoesterase [Geobacter sp.]|nr:phosphoesterase [Geobacter sp.]